MDRLWNANYLKAWSANFMLYFSFMVMTPLLPLYLSEVFGATKDETGMVLSGYALTALLVRPFSGFFVDSFPRKRKCCVTFSSCIHSSILGASFISNLRNLIFIEISPYR
jgi:MFS family permease